ncbi:MAG: FtsX-like permease family protein [Devosia sp.]
MILAWLRGLLRTRLGRLAAAIGGVAIVVALLVDLGLFLDQSARSMTGRALQSVSTDWQVELVPGADPVKVTDAIGAAVPVHRIDRVDYAAVDAFEFKSDGTVQTTGAGKAVGLPKGYFATRSADIRVLAGNLEGAVLLQQTAANLHAQPGDNVTLRRTGQPDATVKVSGVVDLRSADSFFQAVGVPPGAAPTAPPDNAVLLPSDQWASLFASSASARSEGVRAQLHVILDHRVLSSDPEAAYAYASSAGRNFEARAAGTAVLGNNLAAQLDAARGDALYARVLFVFLGAPGVALGVILTFVVAASGRRTRERDQGLLKLRGASPQASLQYVAVEAGLIGILGALLGVVLAFVVGVFAGSLSASFPSWPWIAVGVGAGLALAAAAILVPAYRSASLVSFATTRQRVVRTEHPLWQRLYLDLICVAVGGVLLWRTAATGYQIVLAAEGVAATAVDYTSFLAPLLFWIGAALFVVRLTRGLLGGGRRRMRAVLSPLAGRMAPAVASALSWQRRRIALGVATTTLAVAFLVSTSIFNATYEAQARVDADLTNGADLTITGTTAAPAGALIEEIRKIPGITDAEPMQHRFAYVGTDLQDLYGINAATIGRATTISNAYFQNGDASGTLALLAQRPDAVLVSEETVTDFQLALGDTINLRLQGADHVYRPVPFVFSGVAREFPTAPRDSFLVANADYISKVTGTDAAEVVLARTNGDLTAIKAEVEGRLNGRARVSSLGETINLIASSLTAVDLRGLSRIELVFAVLLAVGSTALVLALGFADRRRDFAILRGLGANVKELAAFVWSEVAVVVGGGLVAGSLLGLAIAMTLVTVLQGVFDPPPEFLTLPWTYLMVALFVIAAATFAAGRNAIRNASASPTSSLREEQ